MQTGITCWLFDILLEMNPCHCRSQESSSSEKWFAVRFRTIHDQLPCNLESYDFYLSLVGFLVTMIDTICSFCFISICLVNVFENKCVVKDMSAAPCIFWQWLWAKGWLQKVYCSWLVLLHEMDPKASWRCYSKSTLYVEWCRKQYRWLLKCNLRTIKLQWHDTCNSIIFAS